MIAKAQAKFIRISPLKVRPVAKLINGEGAIHSISLLSAINKRGASLLRQVVASALANAKNKGYEENTLFISKAVINPGPTLKRYRPASFGRATMIRKRTSHIIIELDTTEKTMKEVRK